jgi:hypothetical protein
MLKHIVQWRAGDLSLEADSKIVSIIPVLVRATDDDERGTGITHRVCLPRSGPIRQGSRVLRVSLSAVGVQGRAASITSTEYNETLIEKWPAPTSMCAQHLQVLPTTRCGPTLPTSSTYLQIP